MTTNAVSSAEAIVVALSRESTYSSASIVGINPKAEDACVGKHPLSCRRGRG